MSKKAFSFTVFGLLIAGGLSSFYLTSSLPQFTALNFVYLMLAALLSVAGVMALVRDKSPALTEISIAALAFLGVALLSSILSKRFFASLTGTSGAMMGLFSIFAIALVSYFAYLHAEELLSLLTRFAPLLATPMLIAAFIADMRIAAKGVHMDAAHLGFANSSELGLFFLLLLPFVLSSSEPLFKEFKAEKYLRIGIALTVLYTLFYLETRFALILGIFVFLIYLMSLTQIKPRLRNNLIGGGAALGLVGLVVLAYLEMTDIIKTAYLSIRPQLWNVALSAAAKNPILGFGADGYREAFMSLPKDPNWWGGPPHIIVEGTSDPHNILVLVLVSFGVLGLLALLALVVFVLIRLYRNGRFERAFAPEIIAAIASSVVLLTMPTTLNLLPLVVLMWAIALGINQTKAKPLFLVESEKITRSLMLVFGLVTLLFGLYVGVVRLTLGPVEFYNPAPYPKAELAHRLLPFDPYLNTQLNNAYFKDMQNTNQREALSKAFEDRQSWRALSADKRDPYLVLSFAQTYMVRGDNHSAKELLGDALKRYPDFPDASARLAEIYLSEANFDAARAAIKPIYNLGELGERIYGGLLEREELKQP